MPESSATAISRSVAPSLDKRPQIPSESRPLIRMFALIHRLQAVLLQVIADSRWVPADALPDLLEGEAFGQIPL